MQVPYQNMARVKQISKITKNIYFKLYSSLCIVKMTKMCVRKFVAKNYLKIAQSGHTGLSYFKFTFLDRKESFLL